MSQKCIFLNAKKSTKLGRWQAPEVAQAPRSSQRSSGTRHGCREHHGGSPFSSFDSACCRVSMQSHRLQGITGGTFSTSPPPRRHWLTVCRGLEVVPSNSSDRIASSEHLKFLNVYIPPSLSWRPRPRDCVILLFEGPSLRVIFLQRLLGVHAPVTA